MLSTKRSLGSLAKEREKKQKKTTTKKPHQDMFQISHRAQQINSDAQDYSP